jgi:hypothetical protein
MIATFRSSRYFHTSNGWYVNMRPGDEQHASHCGFRLVEFTLDNGRPVAGPFKTKRLMFRWLDCFIAFYGSKTKRDDFEDCIPDQVIFPEWTTMESVEYSQQPY